MFTGNNPSQKEFDVIDEDGDVLGSFNEVSDALACAKSAPWWHGTIRIRRDRDIVARRHAVAMRDKAEREAAFRRFCYDC